MDSGEREKGMGEGWDGWMDTCLERREGGGEWLF